MTEVKSKLKNFKSNLDIKLLSRIETKTLTKFSACFSRLLLFFWNTRKMQVNIPMNMLEFKHVEEGSCLFATLRNLCSCMKFLAHVMSARTQ